MGKNEPFAAPLPVLHPMDHLQAYILDVVKNYQKYDDMMNASVKPPARVLCTAIDMRKIAEELTRLGSSVNDINVNYENLLLSFGIVATDVMGAGLRQFNGVFSDYSANYA